MASVVTPTGSPSEEAFMMDVVLVNHPDYKNLPRGTKRWVTKEARKGSFQMSNLLEQTISLRSEEIRTVPLANTNADGMDFDDYSDLKSCTLRLGKNGAGVSDAITGRISGLDNKVGDIRVILWNDYNGDVEYYHIPKNDAISMQSNGSIRISAPRDTGVVKKLQPFRCDSFDDLVLR
jgi:hypothetical protein